MVTHSSALAGKTLLVVEDEYFLAEYIAMSIERAGGMIAGPFADADGALEWLGVAEHRADAATLDICIRGGTSYIIAEELQEMGVPFLFASANDQQALPARFSTSVFVPKPFAADQVVESLAVIVSDTGLS